MKLIAISDLHGILPKITEKADILIIAGDISPTSFQSNLLYIENWLTNIFCPWILTILVEKVILVAGNHDFWFQRYGDNIKKIYEIIECPSDFKITYLHHNSIIIYGNDGDRIKIFGTPYCHIFGNWPFMISDEQLDLKFKNIPKDIDILISHDPPFGVCDVDVTLQKYDKSHKGNISLTNTILEIKPKLVICGHIHTGDHRLIKINDTEYINVSILDEQYLLTYLPFIYDRIYNI